MFDPRLTRSLLAICMVAAPLAAPSSALTPQTPPPCSADGYCKPDVKHYGYTPQQWRRWPGSEELDKQPGGGAGGVQLRPSDRPRKEVEDQTAPPKVEGIEPQPRDLGEDTERTDDGFLPRRPGEDQFPPRAPERQPGGGFVPPDDDRPPFLRDDNRGPGAQPPLVQPPIPQPDLNQPGFGPPPAGQPPVRPQDPIFNDPTLPPSGGSNPDDELFPSFNSRPINDDAPPALPLLNGPVVERPRPSTPTPGVVRQAPTAIPRPTADRMTSVGSSPGRAPFVPREAAPMAGRGVVENRAAPAPKVDRSIEAASFKQDAPPSLPTILLQ